MLTEEQIQAIANDARTKPPAEVARHVMPLIGHITAAEDRRCQRCRHWVPYNQAEEIAARGECLVHAAGGPVRLVGSDVALLTPWDWQCKGWEERLKSACDARQAEGT